MQTTNYQTTNQVITEVPYTTSQNQPFTNFAGNIPGQQVTTYQQPINFVQQPAPYVPPVNQFNPTQQSNFGGPQTIYNPANQAVYGSYGSGPQTMSGPYTGTTNMIPATGMQNILLSQTPVNDLELKKRMLTNQNETQMKYADMEADKQKRLEDKAEKQRDKAAKWKSRGTEFMVARHEKKAATLEIEAHQHQMAAENYKLAAKKFEDERKMYDPPAEKKATTDKKGEKKDEKEVKKEEKKDEKEAKKDAARPSTDLKEDNKAASPSTDAAPPPPVQPRMPQAQPSTTTRQEPVTTDPARAHQQDVSTAALRYANANQQALKEQQNLLQLTQETGMSKP